MNIPAAAIQIATRRPIKGAHPTDEDEIMKVFTIILIMPLALLSAVGIYVSTLPKPPPEPTPPELSSFVGKTIREATNEIPTIIVLHFTDGTSLRIKAYKYAMKLQ